VVPSCSDYLSLCSILARFAGDTAVAAHHRSDHRSCEGKQDPYPVIVFLRYASVADTLLPAVFLANPNGLKLRYVLKHELLLDPCLDIVGNRLPNSFVQRSAGDKYPLRLHQRRA
jgi:hypothetical protein